MWSTLLRKAILCVFYVLLLYCDVIVLSQRLRLYDVLDHNDILSNHSRSRSHPSVGNYSDVHSEPNAPTRFPLIHRTKASEDSQYIHGMTYQEHKKIAAASEPYTQFRRHRFQAIDAPSVPSWRVARTTEASSTESTTVAEMPYSYFGTTPKPLSFESDSYWPDRYGSRSRVRPTIRVETVVNSTFGQARVETGLKPRNLCCQNGTESDSEQSRGRFQFYNSFSRDHGYAPRPALQFVTTTTTTSTTARPVYRWNDRYSASQGSNQFYERASSLGLSDSRRVIGAQSENSIEWPTTRRPYRTYTTTWVPRTTKERLENSAFNSLWNTNGHSDVDVEPYHPRGSLPRSGFDGVRGLRPWDDRPISTSTTTTSTRRPATLSAANTDEYDYYDELEKRQTSTTKSPWMIDYRRTTESPTTRKSFRAPTIRSEAYDPWIFRGPSTTTSTTPSPYIEYPPGPRYKPYDEDSDFKEWKSRVEQKVQRMQRPSKKTKTAASRMRVTGSPSLENDIAPLLKVSGIEEEDWKFVHETNSFENSFRPEEKFSGGRYRSEWNSGLISEWPTDRRGSRNDDFSLGSPRRTTRATETLMRTVPPSIEIWSLPSTLPRSTEPETTSPVPKVFVPPTRRFVPRKPVVIRRRTTPRNRNVLRYRSRLYTPPGTISQIVPSEESVPAAAENSTPESVQSSSITTGIPPFASERSTEPNHTFGENFSQNMASVTASEENTSTAESFTSANSYATSAINSRFNSHNIATTTTTVRPSTTTTRAPTLTFETHWLTTRRPVFGEGMSIDEQLAEAMRRLQERRRTKELENQKKKENKKLEQRKERFDGSGDWENEIANDAPVVVESVPEIADLSLQNDLTIEHEFRDAVVEDDGDAEISGELVDEHIMHVETARRPPKSDDRRSRSFQRRIHV